MSEYNERKTMKVFVYYKDRKEVHEIPDWDRTIAISRRDLPPTREEKVDPKTLCPRDDILPVEIYRRTQSGPEIRVARMRGVEKIDVEMDIANLVNVPLREG